MAAETADVQLTFHLALIYYRTAENRAKLDYAINTKLSALWKQATRGRFDAEKQVPLGFFDFVGKDRRKAWMQLGDLSHKEAMQGFVDTLCEHATDFNGWLAQRLKEKLERERRERERQEAERCERERLEAERLARIKAQEEARLLLERERLEQERSVLPAPSPRAGQVDAAQSHNDIAGNAKATMTPDIFKKLLQGNSDAQLQVGRGEVVRVRVPKKGPGDVRMVWQFVTEDYDIGFGLDFETLGAEGMDVRQILPVMRCAADTVIVTGSHTSEEKGNWLLVFDNSYSILRSKTVYYRIICGPKPA